MNGAGTVAARIQARRGELELTRVQLAAVAGVERDTLRKIEDGHVADTRAIETLADALGVSASWLRWGVEAAPELDNVELWDVAEALSRMSVRDRDTFRGLLVSALGAQRRREAARLLAAPAGRGARCSSSRSRPAHMPRR